MKSKFIIGSGGGKGGSASRAAVESPDSLRSGAYARVLDLISEGEIEGLANGLRSIYFDDTPLQNEDGTFNFTGVDVETRNGTAGQTHIELTGGIESETAVGVEVKQANPIERTITDANADWARITIGVPVLTSQNTSNGDIGGTSVSYRVEVSAAGGAFKPVYLSTVGKSFGWQWFFGSSGDTTAEGATGFTAAVRWTPNYPTTSGRKKPATATFRFEYRKTGATTWISAGEQTATADIQTVQRLVVPDGFGSGSAHYEITYEWPTEFVCCWFDVTGLEPSAYETRVVCVSTNEPSHGGSNVASGTASVQYVPATISGKCTSRYQRAHVIRLADFGAAPWILRVTRETPDSTSSALQNKTFWDSLTTIYDEKLNYPYSALVGLRVSAEQFQTIPRRGYEIRGLKINVPTNYDPITRVYSGSWDGTFKIAWTDNPAWVFYDLATNSRYGVGDYVPAALVDKWALYSIAQYCDELVPDGFGGMEPRYTCNLYLQSRQEAYTALTSIASIFRGMVYWSTGALFAVADRPQTPRYLFTAANVLYGVFTYAGANQKARHNVAYVTWNDPKDMYRQRVEYVADESLIAKWGYINQAEVTAVGCTSRGQARRVGEWLIYTERFEAETVSFVVGMDGNIPRPGDVISIADANRAGTRRGGRVTGGTASSIQLDAPVTLAAATAYTLSIVKPDGTVETQNVTTAAGTVSTLTVSPAFAAAPVVGAIYILSDNAVSAAQYRVISITEQDGGTQYQITALAHYPAKFNYIEHSRDFQIANTSQIGNPFQAPPEPADISVSETLILVGQAFASKIVVSWTSANSRYAVARYRLEWREVGGNWQRMDVPGVGAEITAVVEGKTYEIRVFSINALGLETASPTVETYTVFGKTAPPENVGGFVVARSGDTLNFRWNAVADIDVTGYEIRTGTLWDAATPIGTTSATSFAYVSPRGGTFMIKAVDSSNPANYSQSASIVTVADLSGINVTVDYTEESGGWNGTCHNVESVLTSRKYGWSDAANWGALATWGADAVSGGLIPTDDTETWNSLMLTWEAYDKPWVFLFQSNPAGGTYITEQIDIGYIAQCGVQIYPKVEILQSQSKKPWRSWTQTWSAYIEPWATVPAEIDPSIGLAYEISTSEDGIGWSEFQQYTPGIYQFRHLRFRITIASADATSYLPMLTGFRVSVDVPDRVEHFEDQSIPLAGKTLTFATASVDIATVQVTLQGGAIGDTYKVAGKTNTSVTINVYDSTGAAKAGLADVDVFGYGNRL